MKNWNKYLAIQKAEYLRNPLPTDFAADLVVIIPCYNEPELLITLKSLCKCQTKSAKTLIVIILNSGIASEEAVILQNKKSLIEIADFATKHDSTHLKFMPFNFENLPRKHAGVGLARKTGMDLAIKYFLDTQNKKGVIVSLDADCTVSSNFLRTINKAYRSANQLCCTIHNFKHRIEDKCPQLEQPIQQYEAYIRYFSEQLKKIGFPYYYHTIGSAFSVSADAYVRAGGMGRQQGGEDFYFLHKVFPLGQTLELVDVYVCPMARFSDRIPFGTGPALQKIVSETEGKMYVYSQRSFQELKTFFVIKDLFFKEKRDFIEREIAKLHPSVVQFIKDTNFVQNIEDCNQNSSGLTAYRKRFFHHFNAFKIIKYLNFVHPTYFLQELILEI